MDAEGARALARRIEAGPPPADETPGAVPTGDAPAADAEDPDAVPTRNGVRVYSTERQAVVVDGRPAIVRRRVCKTLVDGCWVTSVVREEVLRPDGG